MKKVMKNVVLKLVSNTQKIYINVTIIYHFLPERMKTAKVRKLVANLHNTIEYVIHIRNLKQAFKHEMMLKKLNRMIKFHQKSWLKTYIDMNTHVRKAAKR